MMTTKHCISASQQKLNFKRWNLRKFKKNNIERKKDTYNREEFEMISKKQYILSSRNLLVYMFGIIFKIFYF